MILKQPSGQKFILKLRTVTLTLTWCLLHPFAASELIFWAVKPAGVSLDLRTSRSWKIEFRPSASWSPQETVRKCTKHLTWDLLRNFALLSHHVLSDPISDSLPQVLGHSARGTHVAADAKLCVSSGGWKLEMQYETHYVSQHRPRDRRPDKLKARVQNPRLSFGKFHPLLSPFDLFQERKIFWFHGGLITGTYEPYESQLERISRSSFQHLKGVTCQVRNCWPPWSSQSMCICQRCYGRSWCPVEQNDQAEWQLRWRQKRFALAGVCVSSVCHQWLEHAGAFPRVVQYLLAHLCPNSCFSCKGTDAIAKENSNCKSFGCIPRIGDKDQPDSFATFCDYIYLLSFVLALQMSEHLTLTNLHGVCPYLCSMQCLDLKLPPVNRGPVFFHSTQTRDCPRKYRTVKYSAASLKVDDINLQLRPKSMVSLKLVTQGSWIRNVNLNISGCVP